MIAYISRRLMQSIVVLLAVSFICFAIFQYAGDPVWALAGKYASPEQKEEIRERLGLNKPFYIQYLMFLKNVSRGNFGQSYVSRTPVLPRIAERMPASIELAATAIVFAAVFGISLGSLAALRPNALFSRLIMAGSLIGISIPSFLTGVLLIMIFGAELGILPPSGRGETVKIIGFWSTGFFTINGLKSLVLPAIALGLQYFAMILRLCRGKMIEVLEEDYTRTAWSKGLPQIKVVLKHALRNAIIPVITMLGMQFGGMIAFSTVTETIFSWPGAGKLLLTSIYQSDNPVTVAYIMLVSVIILLLNLAVDVSYAFLDPRIRYD